jgi:hypothetical protein
MSGNILSVLFCPQNPQNLTMMAGTAPLTVGIYIIDKDFSMSWEAHYDFGDPQGNHNNQNTRDGGIGRRDACYTYKQKGTYQISVSAWDTNNDSTKKNTLITVNVIDPQDNEIKNNNTGSFSQDVATLLEDSLFNLTFSFNVTVDGGQINWGDGGVPQSFTRYPPWNFSHPYKARKDPYHGTITATEDTGDATLSYFEDFYLIVYNQGTAEVSIDIETAKIGSPIGVAGQRFLSNSAIQLQFGNSLLNMQVKTDSFGNFRTTINVPSNAVPNHHYAILAFDGMNNAESNEVWITN